MAATRRHVTNAVNLIIAGAMRDIENGGGDGTASEVYFAVLSELKDWMEGEEELVKMMAEELANFCGGTCQWSDDDTPSGHSVI